jgi:hypothetical protein
VTTAADYEPELVDALNLLIEDERASVEMEVALASGATEYAERETLARMGAEDIHSCETLRAEMESAGLPVTPQINGVVFEVLGAERYDDRLRAFAHHQRIVADRASDLLESNLEGEMRAALVDIVDAHQRHIEWANHRADEFAATRLMEFGPRHTGQPADSGVRLTRGVDTGVATPEAAAPEVSAPEADNPLPDIVALERAEHIEHAEEAMEDESAALAAEALTELAPEAAPEEPSAPADAEPPALDVATVADATPEATEATEATEAPVAPEAAIAAEAPAEPATQRPRRGRPRKSASPPE